jgi:hypothetical protein
MTAYLATLYIQAFTPVRRRNGALLGASLFKSHVPDDALSQSREAVKLAIERFQIISTYHTLIPL